MPNRLSLGEPPCNINASKVMREGGGGALKTRVSEGQTKRQKKQQLSQGVHIQICECARICTFERERARARESARVREKGREGWMDGGREVGRGERVSRSDLKKNNSPTTGYVRRITFQTASFPIPACLPRVITYRCLAPLCPYRKQYFFVSIPPPNIFSHYYIPITGCSMLISTYTEFSIFFFVGGCTTNTCLLVPSFEQGQRRPTQLAEVDK
jgi:hypothetical protein